MSENTRQPQNNIKPPQRGERLKMWSMFDNIAKAHKSGVIPSKKFIDACYEAGMNVSSAVVQVTYWVQWNGYRRENQHVLTTASAKAPATQKTEPEKPKVVVKKAALPKPPAKPKAATKKPALPEPPAAPAVETPAEVPTETQPELAAA